ncbi:hypothetical protein FN846DRAFT_919769, partial [Sphaerosporella brunnea]
MSSAALQPLDPPRKIRIKRARRSRSARTEPTAKKTKTETPNEALSYVFRLSHTFTRFQPTEGVVRKLPALEGATSTDEEHAEEDVTKRRKIAAVRKYQLSGRARGRHEPYSGAGRHSAKLADSVVDADTGVITKTEMKRPRTHPKDKEMIRSRSKELEDKFTLGYEEDEKLMRDMERMVQEYLNADTKNGIKNLPPSKPAANDKIGGGVGGGTWKVDQEKYVIMTDEEDEEGYVYDVYYREEVPTGAEAKSEGVFAESEVEAWWYWVANEEDGAMTKTPMPAFPEDENDEHGIAYEEDEDVEDEYSDSEPELEYDLDDSGEDDDEDGQGTWSLD